MSSNRHYHSDGYGPNAYTGHDEHGYYEAGEHHLQPCLSHDDCMRSEITELVQRKGVRPQEYLMRLRWEEGYNHTACGGRNGCLYAEGCYGCLSDTLRALRDVRTPPGSPRPGKHNCSLGGSLAAKATLTKLTGNTRRYDDAMRRHETSSDYDGEIWAVGRGSPQHGLRLNDVSQFDDDTKLDQYNNRDDVGRTTRQYSSDQHVNREIARRKTVRFDTPTSPTSSYSSDKRPSPDQQYSEQRRRENPSSPSFPSSATRVDLATSTCTPTRTSQCWTAGFSSC